MKKLLTSIRVFILLTQAGFFFSENLHKDKRNVDGLGELWGFVRLNFERKGVKGYAIVDIDLAQRFDGTDEFYSVHAGPEHKLFRYDSKKH